jgi:L-asparaginase
MRPATALSPDGPQNLADAVATARAPGVQGVLAVLAGRVHAGADLRKLHGYSLDAFSSGDAGVLALLEDGALRCFRPWPSAPLHAASAQLRDAALWPRVDIVTSHAGAQGRTLDALVASGARGVVIAGTGNGSVHADLLTAARRAQAAGVRVWRSSRCVLGGVVGEPSDALHSAGTLTPVQARIELMLDLMTG